MTKMNQKGFTLIEAIVVMAIISILSVSLYGGVMVMNKQYGIITKNANYDNISSQLLNVLTQYSRYADEVSFEEIDGGWLIDIEDNTIYQFKDGKKRVLFASDYFDGCDVQLSFSSTASTSQTLEIELDLYEDGEKVYTCSTYVLLMNMELHGKELDGRSQDSTHTLYLK